MGIALSLVALSLSGLANSQQDTVGLEFLWAAPGDQSILGQIADVDLLPDGRLLVLDAQAKQLFVYGSSGLLERTIGRSGEGPGEIKGASEVEVSPDGRIVLLDWGNVRFSVWSANGSFEGSSRLDQVLRVGREWPHEFLWSDVGPVIKVTQFQPGHPILFLHLGDSLDQLVDTLAVVPDGPDSPNGPFAPVSVSRAGRVFAAKGDTVYSISQLRRDGLVEATFSRSEVPAVELTKAEADAFERVIRRFPLPDGVTIPKPPIPRFHSRFRTKTIDFDQDGRLWACPTTNEGTPSYFDIFSSDGRFVASARIPHHITAFRIRGSRLLAISESVYGEPIVRVYRIQ